MYHFCHVLNLLLDRDRLLGVTAEPAILAVAATELKALLDDGGIQSR